MLCINPYNIVNIVSERAKQTEATGDRFTESKNINKSLLTLGNVIKGRTTTHDNNVMM